MDEKGITGCRKGLKVSVGSGGQWGGGATHHRKQRERLPRKRNSRTADFDPEKNHKTGKSKVGLEGKGENRRTKPKKFESRKANSLLSERAQGREGMERGGDLNGVRAKASPIYANFPT